MSIEWNKTPVLAKIKIGTQTYWMKDAEAREWIETLDTRFASYATIEYVDSKIAAEVTRADGKYATIANLNAAIARITALETSKQDALAAQTGIVLTPKASPEAVKVNDVFSTSQPLYFNINKTAAEVDAILAALTWEGNNCILAKANIGSGDDFALIAAIKEGTNPTVYTIKVFYNDSSSKIIYSSQDGWQNLSSDGAFIGFTEGLTYTITEVNTTATGWNRTLASSSTFGSGSGKADIAVDTDVIATVAYVDSEIADEASARSTKDIELQTRIENLEARGRFLSSWDCTIGKPGDYPSIAVGAKYAYKTGDYYIVSKVDEAATPSNLKPAGTEISRTGESTWTIPTAAESNAVSVGDEYLYTTAGWVLIHDAQKKVSWGNIGGTLSSQTDLQNALDAKVNAETGKSLIETTKITKLDGIETGAQVNKIENVKLNGSFLSVNTSDPEHPKFVDLGSIATTEAVVANVNYVEADHKLTQTKGTTTTDIHTFGALADKSSASGTVAGQTITGVTATGTSTGSLTGSLAYASTAATSTGLYTAAGTVAGTVTATGTVAVTLNNNTIQSMKTAGSAAAFTQGSKASLTDQTTGKFANKVLKPVIDSGDTECLTFTYVDYTDTSAASAFSDAVTNRGTFTANGDDTFTANVLPTFEEKTVGVASATFTGNAEGDAINATFSGTEKAVNVTGNYDKATLGTVAFQGAAIELAVGDIAVSAKTVTVQ